jgi:hypothetical protein
MAKVPIKRQDLEVIALEKLRGMPQRQYPSSRQFEFLKMLQHGLLKREGSSSVKFQVIRACSTRGWVEFVSSNKKTRQGEWRLTIPGKRMLEDEIRSRRLREREHRQVPN